MKGGIGSQRNFTMLPKNIVRYLHQPAGLADGVADDNKPYTSAGYTNGPGYLDHRTSEGQWQPRMNLTDVDVSECTLTVNLSMKFSLPSGKDSLREKHSCCCSVSFY